MKNNFKKYKWCGVTYWSENIASIEEDDKVIFFKDTGYSMFEYSESSLSTYYYNDWSCIDAGTRYYSNALDIFPRKHGLFILKISDIDIDMEKQFCTVKFELKNSKYFGGNSVYINYSSYTEINTSLLLISLFGYLPSKHELTESTIKNLVGKKIICFTDNHILDINDSSEFIPQNVVFYPTKLNLKK